MQTKDIISFFPSCTCRIWCTNLQHDRRWWVHIDVLAPYRTTTPSHDECTQMSSLQDHHTLPCWMHTYVLLSGPQHPPKLQIERNWSIRVEIDVILAPVRTTTPSRECVAGCYCYFSVCSCSWHWIHVRNFKTNMVTLLLAPSLLCQCTFNLHKGSGGLTQADQ